MEFKWLKRSHRDVDLYFEGYAKEEKIDPATGRKRTDYVYHGDYYIFRLEAEEYRRFRLGSAARVIAAAALFAAAHILGPRGSILPYIGVPAVLSLIPLCFVLMGLVTLWGTKEPKMTIRQYSFGLGRMENSLWILWILWAVAAVGEPVYMLVRADFAAPEPASAGLQLAALALALWQQRSQARVLAACIHKPETSDDTKPSE